jgi:hypothetical protein
MTATDAHQRWHLEPCSTRHEERDVSGSLEGVCARVDVMAGRITLLSGHIDDYKRLTRDVLVG